jgi:hypothetical protein
MKFDFDKKNTYKTRHINSQFTRRFAMPFLDPVVLKQYIKEYEKKRTEKLSTTLGYLGNQISSYFGGANSLDVEKTCKGFKKSFVEDKAPKDRITLLLKLGRTGWIAQNLKLTNSIPSLLQSLAKLWMDSASDYAKNLAAIRNDMLAQILSNEVLPNEAEQTYKLQIRAELDATNAQLEQDRQKQQLAWYQAIKSKKSVDDIRKCKAAYDATLRDMAYLGNDFHLLTSGRMDELFPGAETPTEINEHSLDSELNRDDQHKPNPHIPSILQLIYAEMYIKKELSTRLGEDATVKGFETLARKEFNEEAKAGQTTPVLSASATPATHLPEIKDASSTQPPVPQSGSKAPTPRPVTSQLPPVHPTIGSPKVVTTTPVSSTNVKAPTPPVSNRALTVDTGSTPTANMTMAGTMSFNPSQTSAAAAQHTPVDPITDAFFDEQDTVGANYEEEEFKGESDAEQEQEAHFTAPALQQAQTSSASILSSLHNNDSAHTMGAVNDASHTNPSPVQTTPVLQAWTLEKVKAEFHLGKAKAQKKLAELRLQEQQALQQQTGVHQTAHSFNI